MSDTKTEYRLVIDEGYGTPRTYPKRDLDHALKGVEDARRDFNRKRHIPSARKRRVWIECREVTPWGMVGVSGYFSKLITDE